MVYKSYEVGGHLFGIRTNSEVCAGWLDDTLGAYERPDEETEPYFSFWAPPEEGSLGKGYFVLHRASNDLIRTFDPAHIAQRLLAEIEGFALRERDDLLFVEAGVVRLDGVTALVPAEIVPYLRLAGRHVEAHLSLPVDGTLAVDADGRLSAIPRELSGSSACLELARRFGIPAVAGPPKSCASDVPESVDLVLGFHYTPGMPPRMGMSRALALAAYAEYALNLPASEQGLLSLATLVADKPCQLLQSGESPRSTFEEVCAALAEVATTDAATAA